MKLSLLPKAAPQSGNLPRWLLRLNFLLAILSVSTVSAVAQSVTATVDRNSSTLDRPIQLTVEISGAAGQRPRLPDLSAFRVQAGPVGQQVQVVNGQMTASVNYSYYLVAREPGRYEIGPVAVDVDGKSHQSSAFQVEFLAAGAQAEQAADQRDTFLRVSVSEDEPYVGQQVVYTWRFFRRVQVADAQLEEMSFGDLVAEDLGDVREYQTTVDGVQYLVNEIRKALFPQRPGQAVIPPSSLAFSVATRARSRRRSFFDFGRVAMEPRTLRSRELTLRVKPLPQEPPGFSGLVGHFDLSAKLGKTAVAAGESTTLAVTISGTGNVQMIAAPPPPELTGAKRYEDRPSVEIERGAGGLSGRKTFRTALVPLAAGTLEIPPVQLVFFDPNTGQYQTKRSAALAIDVSPGAGGEDLMLTESVGPTTGKVAVKVLADDILPLMRGVAALRPTGLSGWRGSVAVTGLVLPPICFLGFLFWLRRSQRYRADGSLRRRESARRTARNRVRWLATDVESKHDTASLIANASGCLRTFVGDKLGVEGGTLTPFEMAELLEDAAVSEGTVRRARDFLERLEAAQYGAISAAGLQRESLCRTLESLIDSIDSEIKAVRS